MSDQTADSAVTRALGPPAPAARPFLYVSLAASVLGTLFAGYSTSDFVSHLDRQVHSIHCSFIPGAGAEIGESGCRTVMMSPYSSILRDSMWGGLPISLLAFAVFAFFVQQAASLAFSERVTKRETTFLVAGSLLPVLMSVVYGWISTTKIGAVCKLCVGVYASSGGLFLGAVLAHMKAEEATSESPWGFWIGQFVKGCAYVVFVAAVYVGFAPHSPKSSEGCGGLVKPEDPAGIMLATHAAKNGTRSIAVLDPLCPACKNFDARLRAGGLIEKLDIQSVLFPLDATCNWMVKQSLHPGACAVSEAMLCAKSDASKILDWAFANQEELRTQAASDEAGMRRRIEDEFPAVKGCLGTPQARNKVNKSLRWVVANALPVLTPQLFVGDRRVCDEDTDLGLDFTVRNLLASANAAGGK